MENKIKIYFCSDIGNIIIGKQEKEWLKDVLVVAARAVQKSIADPITNKTTIKTVPDIKCIPISFPINIKPIDLMISNIKILFKLKEEDLSKDFDLIKQYESDLLAITSPSIIKPKQQLIIPK